jgi:DNA adenine methylase Dam
VSEQTGFFFKTAAPVISGSSPLIKYAGGKSWLVKILALRLHAHLVKVGGVYVEPFAGSLAMGLAIGWPTSVYADTNEDLINLYAALVDDAGKVAAEVDALRATSGEESYYVVRKSVWPENRDALSSHAWAARTIWLNKNCFNGLMRYNLAGRFNVPWGNRAVPLPSRSHIETIGRVVARATIRKTDFAFVLDDALKNYNPAKLVVYLDPPYGAKLKNVSTRGAEARGGDAKVFTGYSGAFSWEDQVRLANWAKALALRGALVVASNSWSDEVCEIYRDGFDLFQVGVRHSVGATEARRGKRVELLAVSAGHANVVDSIPVKVVCRGK